MDKNEQAKTLRHENDIKNKIIKSNMSNTEVEETQDVRNRNKKQRRNKLTKLERKKLKLKKQENTISKKKEEILAEKKEKASVISIQRLLTDEDFVKIDNALAKQQVTYAKRSLKRPYPNDSERGEFVKLTDIENIYKKRKHDKQARIESVKVCFNFAGKCKKSNHVKSLILSLQKGQEGREKFGYKDGRQNQLCSKTNREKKKMKAFQMLKHKIRGKVKRSFKEKQIALRNHLIKQKRMK